MSVFDDLPIGQHLGQSARQTGIPIVAARELRLAVPHDPEGAAMHEQANHWYSCDPFEQGKWRRVRRAIRRRLQGA